MKLDAYVSLSRHGIFYFRWPIPSASNMRRTVRISLRTRCPKQAGELARYLASYGDTMCQDRTLAQLRYDDLRTKVHAYFKTMLDRRLEKVAVEGPLGEQALATRRNELSLAETDAETFRDMLGKEGTEAYLAPFCKAAGVPLSDAVDSPQVISEFLTGYRDMLKAFFAHHESLKKYDFSGPKVTSLDEAQLGNKKENGITLQGAIDEYIEENRQAKTWEIRTFAKKQATLAVLTEALGPEKPLGAVTNEDVQDIKRLVQGLPVNRNKLPQTKELSIRDSVGVAGLAKISNVTVNSYLSMFQSFFDWAVKNRHIRDNLFAGMRVGKTGKMSQPQRQAFKASALKAVYDELTEDRLGLVKSECHKWASLIGMFSGARLNEICQLEAADIQVQDGVWYFNLTDEGEGAKRLKSGAARRKVPVHNELIRLGLLDYHRKMVAHDSLRLFPEYSYSPRDGYGRALGRWFNDQLTVKLGIKSKNHVFHGLRHTMVTRLGQADVQEPIIQAIVGHARKGVTQQTYNREGYKLYQLKEAIDRFSVE